MKFKAKILDEITIRRSVTRISYEIIERMPDLKNAYLIGIRTRGVELAQAIRSNIAASTGTELPFSELNVNYYRDDIPASEKSGEKFIAPVAGRDVILVDDVLFTGRTTRAAIEAVLDAGRAASIRLAVLVDRGHRELPLRADFVGKNGPTSMREEVVVKLAETDGENSVSIFEKDA